MIWLPGNLAECIDDSPCPQCNAPSLTVKGRVYTVMGSWVNRDGCRVLSFFGMSDDTGHGPKYPGHAAARYRKVQPVKQRELEEVES